MSGSAYHAGSASGSTATGSGKTTPVRLNPVGIAPRDKKVLCKVICVCSRQPDKSSIGANLKQQCVSRNLRDLDKVMGWRSPYKAEVNYDMSRHPPAPIMRSINILEPHPYLPGWIRKYWPGGMNTYPARSGMVRRPDVVIVDDPTQPPTQDNLRSVVEIKFPPQSIDKEQLAADQHIAGAPDKAAVLSPSDCDCSQHDGSENPVKSAISDALSELGRSLRALSLSRSRSNLPGLGGSSPLPPPLPIP
ncbi:VRR-NUC domain-containing protein [Burkholderia gladioli]|uniref:VRR-NUC domain-containing protein n=1 Tax=Burkholderia gladioli TaxID=28095 RepID=UPI0016408CD4|nr:VRR-NUC domain-containing protein [Burkholderia gladioli]